MNFMTILDASKKWASPHEGLKYFAYRVVSLERPDLARHGQFLLQQPNLWMRAFGVERMENINYKGKQGATNTRGHSTVCVVASCIFSQLYR